MAAQRGSLVSLVVLTACFASHVEMITAKLPDRQRTVKARKERSASVSRMNSRILTKRSRPSLSGEQILTENQASNRDHVMEMEMSELFDSNGKENLGSGEPYLRGFGTSQRSLSSQLTGCCSKYQSYDASSMCTLYGQDCESGGGKSHDSGDGNCITDGLSFIGVSFSVNTAHGNPYSYQLCDQFPMENIIDRNYDYIMSMDEDGWLVGGGYKQFDYSGKMPYIDSSHTELLRIGQLDPSKGGTTIEQVYKAMNYVTFAPLSIFPEYVKGGGGHHSGDGDSGSVPSADVTLIVSVVAVYSEQADYSDYDIFLDQLFSAMDAVGGGPCMDDHDTDPHVSMARGVKFKSSYHQYQYFYTVNLEVAVWQKMYPKGVVIGSSSKASFPPNSRSAPSTVGYGNLYFFFDRANITKAFPPNRGLTSKESYYSTLIKESDSDTIKAYYSAVTYIPFNWNKKSGSGSGDQEQQNYEHNPYNWKATMAQHDMTDGWDLPPNCKQEGETFLGIPLATRSESKLQSTSTFQTQFEFDVICDYNYTYIQDFGTNHGWLLGERLGNGVASIVDKDTAHIPLFYMGTTNTNMGGLSLSSMIKVVKDIDFGPLYIKPAFVYSDDNGHIKLQFEADSASALGYLYDNLCKMLGISWNYNKPSNEYGLYSSCAMHSSGDRAVYGCGPDNANTGGFCPQMTIAYRAKFQSDDHAKDFMDRANTFVDYWRSMYPTGIAVGADDFCPSGGCLALFLNRYDVYQVFNPDSGGTWVFYNGASMAPTLSPAPTWEGGCDDPHNIKLDKCFRKQAAQHKATWKALGPIRQTCIILVTFMAGTLAVSVFMVRANRRKKREESYLDFVLRDFGGAGGSLPRKKKKLKKKKRNALEEKMLDDELFDDEFNPGARSRPARAAPTRSRSRSARPNRSSSRGDNIRSGRGDAEDVKSEKSGRSRKSSGRSRGKSREGRRARSRSANRRRERSSSRDPNKRRDHNFDPKRRQLV